MSAGQWHQIPNSAWASVQARPIPPGNGPETKADAWNSLVVDPVTSRVYNVAAGGHNDYAGNEVEYLDLNKATPNWVLALAPTSSSQLSSCGSYYGDGRPAARHSYYGITYSPEGRRIFLLGGAQWCTSGGFHEAISSYNLDSNAYSPSSAHGRWDVGGVSVPACCADPATGDVYVLHNWQIGRWRPGTNTWTQSLNASGPSAYGEYACSAYDSTRGRAFFLGGSAGCNHTYTPATNAMASVTLSGSAAGAVKGDERGMVYVPALDAFLVRGRGAGATVYRINAGTFECTTLATTGGGSVPGTLNGPYNKFLYVPQLRGVIYVPTYDGNTWFLRLH